MAYPSASWALAASNRASRLACAAASRDWIRPMVISASPHPAAVQPGGGGRVQVARDYVPGPQRLRHVPEATAPGARAMARKARLGGPVAAADRVHFRPDVDEQVHHHSRLASGERGECGDPPDVTAASLARLR